MTTKNVILSLALLFLSPFIMMGNSNLKARITEEELIEYFKSMEEFKECFESNIPNFGIRDIQYANLCGHNQQEAIVVASSSYTHTAGPDVYAVYHKNDLGQIVDLPFENVSHFHGKPIYDILQGASKGYTSFSHQGNVLIKIIEPAFEKQIKKLVSVQPSSL